MSVHKIHQMFLKKKNRICSLFKNDRFGIKHKFFGFKLKRYIKYDTRISLKIMFLCLELVSKTKMSDDPNEIEILKKAIDTYDENVANLESYLTYARKRVAYYEVESIKRGEYKK